MNVAVLGGGSWGTALANLCSLNGHRTRLWARESHVVESVNHTRENATFLPGIPLSPQLVASHDPIWVLNDAQMVLLAIPSQFLRHTVRDHLPALPANTPLVICSKGIEKESLLPMHDVLCQELPASQHAQLCVLSGPSFAREVAMGIPTNVTVASTCKAVATQVQQSVSNRRFRAYTSTDVIGVEIGGASKNVIAIAVGASDELGYGSNGRAGLITRGLAEIARLAVTMGANPMTLAGHSGLGDLVLTCTGELSRNRQVGKKLAQGASRTEIIDSMAMVAEGIDTAKSLHHLAQRLRVDMPITEQVFRVLHEQKPVSNAVNDLLARGLKEELTLQ